MKLFFPVVTDILTVTVKKRPLLPHYIGGRQIDAKRLLLNHVPDNHERKRSYYMANQRQLSR